MRCDRALELSSSCQSSSARAVFALSLCREIVLRHGGTSSERKRETENFRPR
jgi:hypothetical protein